MPQPPTHDEHVLDLLPLLVNGSLDADDAAQVRRHVQGCTTCEAGLVEWQAIAAATEHATEPGIQPSPTVLQNVWAAIDATQAPAPEVAAQGRPAWRSMIRVAQLVRAQVPLVPGGVWIVSAAAIAAGFVLVMLMSAAAGVAEHALLGLIIPLVTAVGIAFVYGPENDSGMEVTLATPTSPRLVLMSRILLVFGYNLGLATGLTLALTVLRGGDFSLLASLWLGPMALLGGLSLLLSVVISSIAGVFSAAALLCLHVLTATSTVMSGGTGAPTVAERLWSTNPVLLLVAVVCFAAAVLYVPRREREA